MYSKISKFFDKAFQPLPLICFCLITVPTAATMFSNSSLSHEYCVCSTWIRVMKRRHVLQHNRELENSETLKWLLLNLKDLFFSGPKIPQKAKVTSFI